MPRSNLNLLFFISVISIASVWYQRVPGYRYSRMLAAASDRISHDYYRPVDDLELFEHSMEGMTHDLDPNSRYIKAAEKSGFEEEISKEFGGIGVHVVQDEKTKRITVLLPVPRGPAAEAGINAGDTILRVDGKSVQGMSLTDASKLMRGEPDTPLTVTIRHAGSDADVDIKMFRKVIHEDTVQGYAQNPDGSWDYLLPGTDRIGYIRITGFAEAEAAYDASENTLSDLKRTLKAIDPGTLHGLILDLRDNPGGSLVAAIGVCDLFIASGDIVTTRGRDGKILRRAQATGHAPYAAGPPMVVLVNQYSASASEIVSGCLQDHHRAVVVGQRSYGKGTVQEVVDLGKGLGSLKLTIATFWRPSNRNIHRDKDSKKDDKWGVLPDPGCEVIVNDDELLLMGRWAHEHTIARLLESDAAATRKAPGERIEVVDRVLERAIEVLTSGKK